MLGYVMPEGRGAADALLREVAARLTAEGVALAGAVQCPATPDAQGRCGMELHILPGGAVVGISQNLGALSEGCRLDPDGLERAVGLVDAALDARPHLLIVNKFGKQEVEGRGFRPLIGKALAIDIPVLVALNQTNLAGFQAFADGMAERLKPEAAAVLDWCRDRIGA